MVGLSEIWNNSLVAPEREIQPRDHLWATDIGKAPVDVWLKMKGEPYTNPPNERSRRKFEAGNVFEWIVKLILWRAGVLEQEQKRMEYQYPDLLPVTGRLDFVIGGKPTIKNREKLEELVLPESFARAGTAIINYLAEKYPDGIETQPLEIKSVSAYMFESIDQSQTPLKIHKKQLFHYLKSGNYPKGTIVYICRDDLRMLEFAVMNPSPVEQEYKSDIELLTKYYKTDTMPPLEKPIVWDEDAERFSKNFNVAYSPYLTKLYGFENQFAFDNTYTKTVSSWNRVVERVKQKKEMTSNNKEKIKEMEKMGFNLLKLLNL